MRVSVPLLTGLFLFTGCGDADPATDAAATAAVAAPDAQVSEQESPRGSGTLTLGGTTYRFEVFKYDLGDSPTFDEPTLYGRGRTDAGDNFEVLLERGDAAGFTTHGIDVMIYAAGGMRTFSAGSVLSAAGWLQSDGDISLGQLIRIDGNRITADGLFVDGDEEPVGRGRLEATVDR
jgi:hypothetical protein